MWAKGDSVSYVVVCFLGVESRDEAHVRCCCRETCVDVVGCLEACSTLMCFALCWLTLLLLTLMLTLMLMLMLRLQHVLSETHVECCPPVMMSSDPTPLSCHRCHPQQALLYTSGRLEFFAYSFDWFLPTNTAGRRTNLHSRPLPPPPAATAAAMRRKSLTSAPTRRPTPRSHPRTTHPPTTLRLPTTILLLPLRTTTPTLTPTTPSRPMTTTTATAPLKPPAPRAGRLRPASPSRPRRCGVFLRRLFVSRV